MPKKYPLEFKKQAIRRYEKGESIPALCQELHVSQSTFYHWRNQYRSIQTSAHTRTYLVETVTKISSSDWSYLSSTTDNRMTLLTCVAGDSSQRWCVQAIQAS